MLALQMIRIMDRIWLQEGLDLRIVNFKCISTGKDKGNSRTQPEAAFILIISSVAYLDKVMWDIRGF